jgi:hypothetical protein
MGGSDAVATVLGGAVTCGGAALTGSAATSGGAALTGGVVLVGASTRAPHTAQKVAVAPMDRPHC